MWAKLSGCTNKCLCLSDLQSSFLPQVTRLLCMLYGPAPRLHVFTLAQRLEKQPFSGTSPARGRRGTSAFLPPRGGTHRSLSNTFNKANHSNTNQLKQCFLPCLSNNCIIIFLVSLYKWIGIFYMNPDYQFQQKIIM